jgi:hypothetical protein
MGAGYLQPVAQYPIFARLNRACHRQAALGFSLGAMLGLQAMVEPAAEAPPNLWEGKLPMQMAFTARAVGHVLSVLPRMPAPALCTTVFGLSNVNSPLSLSDALVRVVKFSRARNALSCNWMRTARSTPRRVNFRLRACQR